MILGLVISIFCILSFGSDDFALKKLTELREKSQDEGMISIREDDFSRYVTKGPRQYWGLVVLTAVGGGNCQPCEFSIMYFDPMTDQNGVLGVFDDVK